MIPLDDDAIARWKQEIGASRAQRKTLEPWWTACLKDYWDGAQTPEAFSNAIQTLRSYVNVERKKADLFYQRPDVSLVPSPLLEGPILQPDGQPLLGPPNPQTGQPGPPTPQTVALEATERIVNEQLGPDGIDARRMAHQVLFDILCVAGTGWTKLGYEMASAEQPNPMDPAAPAIQVPVSERCYWEYIPPKQTLRPAQFRSTDWDRAPWLGFEFAIPLTAKTRQQFGLDPDFQGAAQPLEQHFDHGLEQSGPQKLVTGVEIWYRSCLFRDDIVHPEHYTQLVLIDGRDEPAIHQDSPHQEFDGQGQLTPRSLIGNPIHPFNLRILTDSAYPPSDVMLTLALERELDTFRTQMVQYRDAQTMRWRYNTDLLPKDALDKFVRSPIGGMVGMPSEAMSDEAIKELPHGSMPRESFTSNDYIDADIARAWAIDASGSGVQSTGSQTATEVQTVQANANARFDFERSVFLDQYLKGVTKFATLLLRWLPVARAAQIVGPQLAGLWDGWRQTANAAVAWSALPDSALRTDVATMRRDLVDLYTRVAQDPYLQAVRPKIAEKLLRAYHVDATGMVQPPPPQPPPAPKMNFSWSAADLVAPQGPIVLEILGQFGIKVNPDTVATALAAQQQSVAMASSAGGVEPAGDGRHPGMTPEVSSLTKHQDSGGMQGSGAPAPMAPGGQVM